MSGQRYIYFLRRSDEAGLIKIGCSGWPSGRCLQLRADLKMEFSLLATAPGDFTVERNLHYKFRHLRQKPEGFPTRGYVVGGMTEWFAQAPELLEYIAQVKASGVIQLADHERFETIFAAQYLSGRTLRSIGREHGISHERVRQVLSEHGYPTNPDERARFIQSQEAAPC